MARREGRTCATHKCERLDWQCVPGILPEKVASKDTAARRVAEKGLSAYSYFVAYGMQRQRPAYGRKRRGQRGAWLKEGAYCKVPQGILLSS